MIRDHFYALLCLISVFSTVACNSRPTYNIEVYKFASNCDSQTSLTIEHDPEPEVQSVRVDPQFESEADAKGIYFERVKNSIRVHFGSGIECMADIFGPDDMVCQLPNSTALANCTSSLELYSWRYPSRGPGYLPPYAKYPGDEILQSDIEQAGIEDRQRERSTASSN